MAGRLDATMASTLGLPAGTPVTAGSYDSHVDIAAHRGDAQRASGDSARLDDRAWARSSRLLQSCKGRQPRLARDAAYRARLSCLAAGPRHPAASSTGLDSIDRAAKNLHVATAREAGLLVLPYFCGRARAGLGSRWRAASSSARRLRPRRTIFGSDARWRCAFDIRYRATADSAGGRKIAYARSRRRLAQRSLGAGDSGRARLQRSKRWPHAGESIGPARLGPARPWPRDSNPASPKSFMPRDKRRRALPATVPHLSRPLSGLATIHARTWPRWPNRRLKLA